MDWGQSWGRGISILDVLGEHIHEAMMTRSMNIGRNQWQPVFKEFIYIVSKEIRKILQSCECPPDFHMSSCLLSDVGLELVSHTTDTKNKSALRKDFRFDYFLVNPSKISLAFEREYWKLRSAQNLLRRNSTTLQLKPITQVPQASGFKKLWKLTHAGH